MSQTCTCLICLHGPEVSLTSDDVTCPTAELRTPALNGTMPLNIVQVPQECPQAVADAVCQCTQLEPSLRPTARELLQVFIQDDG